MTIDGDSSEGRFYFHFLSVPAEAILNPKLTQTEVLLFSFINNMSRTERGCWASNEYFSNILRVTKRTISNSISNLQKEGYISIINHDGTRRIFIDSRYKDQYHRLVELFNQAYVDNDEDSRKEYHELCRQLGHEEKKLRRI